MEFSVEDVCKKSEMVGRAVGIRRGPRRLALSVDVNIKYAAK